MVANALNTDNRGIIENSAAEVPNVKFYEVMKENAELTKELDKLKTDMQTKINENVRLDADLTVAKSELKYITDKSSSMEAAYSEQKLEVERLNKVIRNRNFALICLGAVLLIILTVASTIALMK
jgi:predicted nuclease with TOPRIM domain